MSRSHHNHPYRRPTADQCLTIRSQLVRFREPSRLQHETTRERVSLAEAHLAVDLCPNACHGALCGGCREHEGRACHRCGFRIVVAPAVNATRAGAAFWRKPTCDAKTHKS